jgi:predicted nucleotidyltransferase
VAEALQPAVKLTLPIPSDLGDFLASMTADFPSVLGANLVGIYLWGSLTYKAFNERYSDVDLIAVTRRDLDGREFSEIGAWFRRAAAVNRWVKRTDMRFVIDGELLDKSSRCCGFYHYKGRLLRHASDGNPIICMNLAHSGVTLWGKDATLIAPQVSEHCLNQALLLELNYLRDDLRSSRRVRSDQAFVHNAYAVLTACRIMYSARCRSLVSKEQACAWAMEMLPPRWHAVVQSAQMNRCKNAGTTDTSLEDAARSFVEFVTAEVTMLLEGQT